jgi:hypothetical protein
MIFAENFEKILIAFNKCKVEYMIAGGYAVVFHGYGRTTGDLDIWVKPTNENKEKIVMALKQLSMPDEIINAINLIEDFTVPFAVKIGEAPLQIDIFNAITQVKFADAEKNAVPYRFSDKLESRFIHLYDLIRNKMLTGRMKDKADVDELQRINKHSKDVNLLAFLKKLFGK